MASGAAKTEARGIADSLVAQAAADGSAAHAYPSSPALRRGISCARNLADVVHYFCMLHGRHPGMLDLAVESGNDPLASEWLREARDAFDAERAYLARLAVAAGPMPSTAGQAESEAVLFSQRHALETLSRSERRGCALGAAIALTLDWRQIRVVLDLAADRFAVTTDPLRLPLVRESVAVAERVAVTMPVERALGFGVQQLLLQHRGLWSLLEAREAARAH